MRIIKYFLHKEFAQLRRDRKMLPIVFIAPVLQLLLLGYAANLDVEMIPLAVIDHDRSVESRKLVDDFVQSGYFHAVSRLEDPQMIDKGIDDGAFVMALVIPAGFSEDIKRGERVPLQALVDGADANTATIAMNYADIIARRYSAGITLSGLASPGTGVSKVPIQVEPRIWYNPELKSRNFMVPGILALLLMIMTMLLTSLAIVKEKEQGTLEHLNVTPITSMQLIIGKLIPFSIIGMVDVFLVLGASRILFGLIPEGSIPLLILLSALFLLTTLGLGLLVSTVSRTQQQAMMSSLFFVMLPMIFLSGFAFPIENMPRIIQYITYALPLRYYFVIIRGIFLKGAGILTLWDETLMLIIFGVAVLGFSAARFKKQI